jgi:hypothetical protein
VTAWETLYGDGTSRARLTIANSKERAAVESAFSVWWRAHDERRQLQPSELARHPTTKKLAESLRAAGLEEAANYAESDWQREGPIHPGIWVFAILLGESFVCVFIESLNNGETRKPNFFGHDTFGAWDAFETSLTLRIRTEGDVRRAAVRELRDLARRILSDPSRFVIPSGAGWQNGVIAEIKKYGNNPTVLQAWQSWIDSHIWVDGAFLAKCLLNVDKRIGIGLIATMPHPAFVRYCFGEGYLASQPDALAKAIAVAPRVFDDDGKFLATGALLVALLASAGEAVRRPARSADGSFIGVSADREDELRPALEEMRQVASSMVAAVFGRVDAAHVALAWLERLFFEGEHRSLWSGDRCAGQLVLDPLGALIAAIAEHLELPAEWQRWVREGKLVAERAAIVVAIAVSTGRNSQDLASMMECLLLKDDINYMGIGDAAKHGQGIIGRMGGYAVSRLDDPADWLVRVWKKLRPARERNWLAHLNKSKCNKAPELLVLWGLAALNVTSSERREKLWVSIERAIRDAAQTDAVHFEQEFWTDALCRLFSHFSPEAASDRRAGYPRLAEALRPYAAANMRFMRLLLFLRRRGWEVGVIDAAVCAAGFNLRRLITMFLEMKKKHLKEDGHLAYEGRKIHELLADLTRERAVDA